MRVKINFLLIFFIIRVFKRYLFSDKFKYIYIWLILIRTCHDINGIFISNNSLTKTRVLALAKKPKIHKKSSISWPYNSVQRPKWLHVQEQKYFFMLIRRHWYQIINTNSFQTWVMALDTSRYHAISNAMSLLMLRFYYV